MTRNEAIITAVDWWVDKINRKEPHDNGDNSPASVFACLFADMKQEILTEINLRAFRSSLAELLLWEVERYLEIDPTTVDICLGCDYHPCAMLWDAAKEAGIPEANFPYKTAMIIESRDGGRYFTVHVSDGYGEPYVELYPVNEEK